MALPESMAATQAVLIRGAVARFMIRYAGCLDRHGLERGDVQQQAWIEWVRLESQWCTNPGKYLDGRLIDWMKKISAFNNGPKKAPRYFVPFDFTKLATPHYDVERAILWREVWQVVNQLEQPLRSVVVGVVQGRFLKEIGQELGVSESRTCQLYRDGVQALRQQLGAI